MAVEPNMNATSLVDALNLANDFRAAFGIETIDSLPEGVPENSEKCILANAFNFGCRVSPKWGSVDIESWVVIFEHRDQAEKFMQILDESFPDRSRTYDKLAKESADPLDWDDTENMITLPEHIAGVAAAFDSGKLPQYDERIDDLTTLEDYTRIPNIYWTTEVVF